MRIDHLHIENFRGFADHTLQFHPEFNLIVGTNGTGKTSLLDALAVAIGSWFLGVRGADTRHIRADEVRLVNRQTNDTDEALWERQYPCHIAAHGEVMGTRMNWQRSLNSAGTRTTYRNASKIKAIANQADQAIRAGESITLPLLSFYGTGRLWQEPRDSFRVEAAEQVSRKEDMSRLDGYRNSVDPRLSVTELTRWIARQAWIGFQKGAMPKAYAAVSKAMLACLEDATHLQFDAALGEVVVEIAGKRQPFSNLSDGQRCMLAMVGDIAQKAARLNPQLGDRVLEETPGVVLIDELDLHLHPRWQRRVIEDLRQTFPKIQFICTTHSPFLIQSLRSPEELVMLDGGQPTVSLGNKSIEEIAQIIQGIANPAVSLRYEEMKSVARSYLEALQASDATPAEKLEQFRQQLAEMISPYAENPAFQAFLEMKRAARLGE